MKKSIVRTLVFTLVILALFAVIAVPFANAEAAKRTPGPVTGPKEPCWPVPCVSTAVPPIVPIVSTNIGPVVTAQMPTRTPNP